MRLRFDAQVVHVGFTGRAETGVVRITDGRETESCESCVRSRRRQRQCTHETPVQIVPVHMVVP